MRNPPIIIFPADAGWKVARGESLMDVPASAGADPEKIAREISTLIESSSAEVTLAIPSSWCLSATVRLDGVPARNRRSALQYRLELLLPLTAEEIAADYILAEPHSALAICVSAATAAGFIDALEATGLMVQSIVPASIYAAHALLSKMQESPDAIVWQTGSVVEIFIIRNQIIAGWYTLPAQVDDLKWHLGQLFSGPTEMPGLVTCSLDQALRDFLKTLPTLKLLSSESRSIDQTVVASVTDGLPSPVQLRRDRLAPGNPLRAIRKPIIELAVAAVLLVVCICVSACWRANQLERLALRYRNRQEQVFHQAFPGHTIPVNIVSRLRSEERKIETGDTDTTTSLPQSTLPTLQSILLAIDSMPAEVRLEVNDLKVDDNSVSIDGIVRNRTDLTAVIDTLQQIGHLQVEAPQTDQLPGKGLHITLTGTSSAEPKRK
jgi:hypothetical protein